MKFTYNPSIFETNTLADAMRIILTDEGAGASTGERWERETPYLVDLFAQHMRIGADTLVLDYGCGIARISHELIKRHGCRVIGADISPSMRSMSVVYARSDRFMSCSPDMLDEMIARGLRVDAAFSVWVLQHCLAPKDDIARISKAVRRGGDVFIVNNDHRAVPTKEKGWVNDTLDIKAMLAEEFEMQQEGRPPQDMTSETLAKHTFWAAYRQRAD
jgi:SAM-dependent methyltransferase